MRVIFAIAIIILTVSCKKDSPCWHSYGDELKTPIRYELDNFHSLLLDGDVFVNLVNDSVNYMEVIGGENSAQFVQHKIENGELIITNENKCGWLRDYKKRIQVDVHFNSLFNIKNISDGEIGNFSELSIDTIFIHQNGTGNINLTLTADRIWLDMYVVGNIELKGSCNTLLAEVASYGHLYAERLKADKVTVKTTHEGDAHVYPIQKMDAYCEQFGDIYYYNKIDNISIKESQEGKVQLIQE